jgi:hypothetical protein
MRIPPRQLLERLVRKGIIRKEDLPRIIQRMKEEPSLLVSEVLRDLKVVPEGEFYRMLCEEYGSEYIDPRLLISFPVEEEARGMVSSEQAEEWGIVPLHYDPHKKKLLVVSAYPFNPHVVEGLPSLIGVEEVEVTFIPHEKFAELWKKVYIGIGELDYLEGEGEWIGVESDEEAFPGIYGKSFAQFLAESGESSTPSGGTSRTEGVRGSLRDLSIVDMLQALGQSRKTCTVHVVSDTNESWVYLQDGWVIHARDRSGRTGPAVVYDLIRWQEGEFEVMLRPYNGEPTMMASVESLLLEGARRFDEESR